MMWCNNNLFADKVDSNLAAPLKKKRKRYTRKKGEAELEKAAATSTRTSSAINTSTGSQEQCKEQREGLSLSLSTSDASRKRKALNKSEKLQIKKSLSDLRRDITTAISLVNVRKQLPSSNPTIEVFCNSIVPNSIKFLAEHLHQAFVNYMTSAQQ